MRKAVQASRSALGVLAGAAYAVWRACETSRAAPTAHLAAAPFPFPPEPVATPTPPPTRPATDARWPTRRRGSTPSTARARRRHPVKAKLASGIFHVPGGANYDRTKRRPLLRRPPPPPKPTASAAAKRDRADV